MTATDVPVFVVFPPVADGHIWESDTSATSRLVWACDPDEVDLILLAFRTPPAAPSSSARGADPLRHRANGALHPTGVTARQGRPPHEHTTSSHQKTTPGRGLT